MATASIPLSPAPSQGADGLPHGLQHIARHNAGSPYPEQYQDEAIHLHRNSNYSTPTPGHDEEYDYRGEQQQQTKYPYQQHQHHDSGLGISYDNFSSDFNDPMYQNYSTPATSPPTPQMHTRSGFAIPRSHQNLKPMPEGQARIEKAPKMKKERKTKAKAEKKVAKLDKPLSELTKDWTHVAVADIEAYVNRSAEERRKEVEEGKIPGKVKRPMNSFMLYRKAYQNRTKDWCLQNNHQVVSQVCGDSWPLEPDEVKEQFNNWARLERQNHQNAHPGYKFSPSKPGATKGSGKRKMSEDAETEESDLDDWEWQNGQSRRTKKYRPSPRPQQVVYPTTRSAYNYSSRDTSLEPSQSGYIRSTFQTTNPGRAMPQPYDQSGLGSGEYYQQTLQPHNSIHGVQDVIVRKAIAPGVHSLLGLPNGGQGYDEIIHSYPQYVGQYGSEYKIDPTLISQENAVYHATSYADSHPEGVYFGGNHNGDQQWQGSYNVSDRTQSQPRLDQLDPEFDNVQIQDQHAHVLRGNTENWHVESLDEGGQFDQWMEKST